MGVIPPYKIALLSYHPISYHAAFYRAVHKQRDLLETVLYLDRFGVASEFDSEFQGKVSWGNRVLDGYRYKFFRNLASRRKGHPVGPMSRINPGVFFHILFSNYDAIVTDYANFAAWLAYVAATFRGIPIILRGEADLVVERKASLWVILKNVVLPLMISHAKAVLYSCRRNREYFLRYGAKPELLFPILSSADTGQFNSVLDQRDAIRRSLRMEYGISDEVVVVIFVGRLVARKRPMDILQACMRLSSDGVQVCTVFVGDGPERFDIEKAAQEHNFRRIIITGFQQGYELARHYLIGDIFVMPSEWDPTPKALNEAISCGLPCIVSDGVGQANDLIVNGLSGSIFPVGDVASLATEILKLAQDDGLRRRVADTASRMAQEWTPEKNAEGLLAALNYIYARPI
jgi:glycosyltransferase involved in cell wall biosynthesis